VHHWQIALAAVVVLETPPKQLAGAGDGTGAPVVVVAAQVVPVTRAVALGHQYPLAATEHITLSQAEVEVVKAIYDTAQPALTPD
jgi:hypothetical protein